MSDSFCPMLQLNAYVPIFATMSRVAMPNTIHTLRMSEALSGTHKAIFYIGYRRLIVVTRNNVFRVRLQQSNYIVYYDLYNYEQIQDLANIS